MVTKGFSQWQQIFKLAVTNCCCKYSKYRRNY